MSDVIVAALIGAIPLTAAALPGLVLLRRTKTNHGKNIGQHVEAQGEALIAHARQDAQMAVWNAEQFAAIRAHLGMPPSTFVSPYPVTDTENA